MLWRVTEFPSLLRLSNMSFCVCTICCLSIHPLMDTSRFHLLAVVNNCSVHGVQISHWDHAFSSSAYMPRSGVAVSFNNSIFSFLRNLHTVFRCSCTILHSCLQSTRVLTYTCYFCFLIVALLMNMKRYLIVGLICIYVITSDVEHLYICS